MNFGLPRCKTGDIAMFERDTEGYVGGRLYTVQKGTFCYVVGMDWKSSAKLMSWFWHIAHFKVSSPFGGYIGTVTGAADAVLRPIRPGDEDEVLRVAGKPAQRDDTLRPKKQVEHSR
jgi:hypothetical protein